MRVASGSRDQPPQPIVSAQRNRPCPRSHPRERSTAPESNGTPSRLRIVRKGVPGRETGQNINSFWSISSG